jgi:hypothetical protein
MIIRIILSSGDSKEIARLKFPKYLIVIPSCFLINNGIFAKSVIRLLFAKQISLISTATFLTILMISLG